MILAYVGNRDNIKRKDMRKIESFALKYNKTIALINVAVTLLMGIASLFVSYNALIVSKIKKNYLNYRCSI